MKSFTGSILVLLVVITLTLVPQATSYEWMSALKLPSFNMNDVKVRAPTELAKGKQRKKRKTKGGTLSNMNLPV